MNLKWIDTLMWSLIDAVGYALQFIGTTGLIALLWTLYTDWVERMLFGEVETVEDSGD